MDMEGTILGIAQRKYDVQKPRADWAEQDADVLWCATKETLRELVQKYPRQAADLAGIGYSGQICNTKITYQVRFIGQRRYYKYYEEQMLRYTLYTFLSKRRSAKYRLPTEIYSPLRRI